MDWLEFDAGALYFEEPVNEEARYLIARAGARYGEPEAESLLHKAYFLAPESLLVLVALYRYYFYQHRLEFALEVGERALTLIARRLGIPLDWRGMTPARFAQSATNGIEGVRFYLAALKAAAYLELRLGRLEAGRARLEKLIELDPHDRFGGRSLLAVLDPHPLAETA